MGDFQAANPAIVQKFCGLSGHYRSTPVATAIEGRADIFLTYRTNALAAQKENQEQQIVALPDSLAVGADYGLTLMNGAPAAAQGFADFIMSSQGQQILTSHGFASGK